MNEIQYKFVLTSLHAGFCPTESDIQDNCKDMCDEGKIPPFQNDISTDIVMWSVKSGLADR